MAEPLAYEEPGDPIDFAPDFKTNPEPYGEPMPELLSLFKGLTRGSKVLDVAGGYGRYAMPLIESGLDVTILDIHDASLEEAKRRKKAIKNPKKSGNLTLLKADILREKLPVMEKFECVFSAGFLHHLSETALQDTFKNMSELLENNGTAIIEYSTNKNRRLPGGEKILVGGDPEHNSTLEEGIEITEGMYEDNGFKKPTINVVHLCIRQPDFWYDADVILATGRLI